MCVNQTDNKNLDKECHSQKVLIDNLYEKLFEKEKAIEDLEAKISTIEIGRTSEFRPEPMTAFIPSSLPVLSLNPFGSSRPLSLPLSMNQAAMKTIEKSKADHKKALDEM